MIYQYNCNCGHEFPEALGKYGCPNCEDKFQNELISYLSSKNLDMTIQEVKRKLGITNQDIADYFGYKNYASYQNSPKKKQVEEGIIKLYEKFTETK